MEFTKLTKKGTTTGIEAHVIEIRAHLIYFQTQLNNLMGYIPVIKPLATEATPPLAIKLDLINKLNLANIYILSTLLDTVYCKAYPTTRFKILITLAQTRNLTSIVGLAKDINVLIGQNLMNDPKVKHNLFKLNDFLLNVDSASDIDYKTTERIYKILLPEPTSLLTENDFFIKECDCLINTSL
jgi:hypothetical protein